MPRRKRVCTGGYVFHVLNRAVARERIFDDEGDYKAFEKVLREAIERVPVRVLSFCLMPNHWHEFVNQPETEAELAAVRQTLKRGSPFGDKNWISQTAERLGLESTLAPRGRPPR